MIQTQFKDTICVSQVDSVQIHSEIVCVFIQTRSDMLVFKFRQRPPIALIVLWGNDAVATAPCGLLSLPR